MHELTLCNIRLMQHLALYRLLELQLGGHTAVLRAAASPSTASRDECARLVTSGAMPELGLVASLAGTGAATADSHSGSEATNAYIKVSLSMPVHAACAAHPMPSHPLATARQDACGA